MTHKKTIFLVLLTLLLTAAAIAAVPLYNVYRAYRIVSDALTEEPSFTELKEIRGSAKESARLLTKPLYTFLVYGVDGGEWVNDTYRPGPARADTIILLQVNLKEKSASMLSIPRDTLVDIPGRKGDDKINHAHAFGGADLLTATVETFTGIPVDFYVQVNYKLFKETVDALGGVEFDVDRKISAAGLRLEPGLQILNGDQAFALISFRREAMGDIARVQRQQRFIAAVGRHIRKSPSKTLIPIVYSGWKHVKSDLSVPEAAELAVELRGIKEENIKKAIVPGWFYNRGGISYWRPDLPRTAEIIKEFYTETFSN